MSRTWQTQAMKQVPNFLSISRIVLAAVFPFLSPSWRLPAIFAAALSEFFDGFLARRWHAESQLGQALDPIADKLFVLSTVGTLIALRAFTWTQFALLAMRDIIVAIGSFSIMFESRSRAIQHLKPKYSGKIATALQFALLIALYAGSRLSGPLFVITALASCTSAIDYMYGVLHRRFDLPV